MRTERLRALRAAGRRALVCDVTAGHPDVAASTQLVRELPSAGCDVLAVGIPFSVPLADGPMVVLFSYFNPLIRAGDEASNRAQAVGVSGVLITDLPVRADPEREAWLGRGPLEYVRMVAPTTPQDRMADVAEHGSGFVDLISRLGVTGTREGVDAALVFVHARAARDEVAG